MNKFDDVKDKILQKIEALPGLEEELDLIPGFVNLRLNPVATDFSIPDNCLVTVVAVGEKTKKVYFFCYNALGIENE